MSDGGDLITILAWCGIGCALLGLVYLLWILATADDELRAIRRERSGPFRERDETPWGFDGRVPDELKISHSVRERNE